jgi:hypothetical protein
MRTHETVDAKLVRPTGEGAGRNTVFPDGHQRVCSPILLNRCGYVPLLAEFVKVNETYAINMALLTELFPGAFIPFETAKDPISFTIENRYNPDPVGSALVVGGAHGVRRLPSQKLSGIGITT